MSGWLRSGDWHTKLPMLVSSVLSLQLASVASRVQRNWAFGSETGYPQMKRVHYGNLQTPKRARESGTGRSLPSF
jgi:hypothetical protein